jgi:hypothetical protein
MDTIQNVSVISPIAQATAQATGADLSKLVDARVKAVKAIKAGEGLVNDGLRFYATWLCSTFNVIGSDGSIIKTWYELKGKASIPVRTEFKGFQDEMVAQGYSPGSEYSYWARIKDMSGRPKKGGKVAGEPTDPLVKTRSEIGTIINRINENDNDRLDEILDLMREAYATLGGDLGKLRTEAPAEVDAE